MGDVWTTVATLLGDPLALAREQLAQPQPGRGSPQAPGLGVTFHCMQLLDPDGERR